MSLHELLSGNAIASGAMPAFITESGSELSHEQLFQDVCATTEKLNGLGIGRNDRVAIVLPQSPELAVAFLSVSACATSAPLNHNYKEEDFRFYLDDLQARALIVKQGDGSPARLAAAALQVPIVELIPHETGNGRFELEGQPRPLVARGGFSMSEDVGLVLHTSGTTSRPKMVPLTQRNLCNSAANIVETLRLTSDDRCLNVMPLFHIHGLVACVLASLAAGGSTACVGTFNPAKFFSWLHRFQPTWYSAVPTMHQAILGQISPKESKPVASSLRLIRSSSAALPPSVMKGLEAAFGIPVIESYGMTEAAHQMTSNPLPPQTRKPGSVGLAAGPQVAILNEANELLSVGATGEISIRGPNVTSGYENNPQANTTAFTAGWFRTGDQGYLDEEDYLFITGRLKEMINRGGENVAPREIDEALLTHPEVKQAVGFAIPHPTLGEDVAAAVILAEGSHLDEQALREITLKRLPEFKVPSRIVILDEIPKGPTGKIQRIGLADKLKDKLEIVFEAPKTETETIICACMESVLGQTKIGRNSNFFSLGGDSLGSVQVVTRLRETLGIDLAVTVLFQLPAPALLAPHIESLLEEKEIDDLTEAMKLLSSKEQAELLGDDVKGFSENL